MSFAFNRVTERVLDQLSRKEMRLLSLVVAIRRDFGVMEGFKGDLTESVKSALRKLVSSKMVVDVEGLYALAEPLEGCTVEASGAQG